MIHDYLLLAVSVLFAVMMLVMLGHKLKIAYPIFLVISGLLISFIPGLPTFAIEPDLIFLIFLPPILFEAAWFTSWQDFNKWKKQIFSLAFGLVFLTSIVVAYLSNSLIPGFTLALGFLLGGVNSPPDAVAATSVLKNMTVPKKINSILEGESLINDASSLIVFKFALAAVLTGQFVWRDAIQDFFMMAIGGTVVGLVLGYAFAYLLKILPTNSNIDTVITILVPYFMYILAEHLHFSGVLAVVAGGLVMSYFSHCYLSHTTRLQAGSVWSVLIFTINVIIFLLIGLELPIIIKGLSEYTIKDGIYYSLIIGGVIVATRLFYCYALALLQRTSKKFRQENPKFDWKEPFIMSFAAMRGVVSLAAALSIPVLMNDGTPFPHRNLILLVTFIIILITLVGQGLLLSPILKLLNIREAESAIPLEKQEVLLLRRLRAAALRRLDSEYSHLFESNRLVKHQKTRLENDVFMMEDKQECIASESGAHYKEALEQNKMVLRDLISAQRDELRIIKNEKIIDDSVFRTAEVQLDLDEAKITGFNH